jgi:hypothetical protein
VVPQGLDVLLPFILFDDFRSLFLVFFFERFRGLSLLGFGGGYMLDPFVVLFPLIAIQNP